MSQENVEIARQANETLNQGDLEGVLEFYAIDAEFRDLRSAPDQPVIVTGRDAMRRVWAEWSAAFDELRAEVDEWIEAGDAVIAHAHWWGTGRESGLAIDTRQYDLFEFDGGKIVRAVLGYESKKEALEAAGVSG
jgi:ketosteroid isomerase-like protein